MRRWILATATASLLACDTYDHDASVHAEDAACDGAACGARPDVAAQDAAPDGRMDAALDAADAPASDAPASDAAADAPADAGCPRNVVVNEAEAVGTSNDARDEFVELYNPGPCDQSLHGWTIRVVNGTDTTVGTVWTGGTADHIAAGGYAVIAGMAYTGTPVLSRFTADAPAAQSAVLRAGVIALFASDGARVDSAGFGLTNGPYVETSAALAIQDHYSSARFPNGTDTQDNSRDFVMRLPSPNAPN